MNHADTPVNSSSYCVKFHIHTWIPEVWSTLENLVRASCIENQVAKPCYRYGWLQIVPTEPYLKQCALAFHAIFSSRKIDIP